jgi:hypothetical protein
MIISLLLKIDPGNSTHNLLSAEGRCGEQIMKNL